MKFSLLLLIVLCASVNSRKIWPTSDEIYKQPRDNIHHKMTLNIPFQLLKGQKVIIHLLDENSSHESHHSDFHVKINHPSNVKTIFGNKFVKYNPGPPLKPKYNPRPALKPISSFNSVSVETDFDSSPEHFRHQKFHPSSPSRNHPLKNWMFGKTLQKKSPPPPVYYRPESYENTDRAPNNQYGLSAFSSEFSSENRNRYSSPLLHNPYEGSYPVEQEDSISSLAYPWTQYHQKLLAQPSFVRPLSVNAGNSGEDSAYNIGQRAPYYPERQLGTSLLSVQQTKDGIQGFIINVPKRCPPNYRPDSSGRCREVYQSNVPYPLPPRKQEIPEGLINKLKNETESSGIEHTTDTEVVAEEETQIATDFPPVDEETSRIDKGISDIEEVATETPKFAMFIPVPSSRMSDQVEE